MVQDSGDGGRGTEENAFCRRYGAAETGGHLIGEIQERVQGDGGTGRKSTWEFGWRSGRRTERGEETWTNALGFFYELAV